MCQYKFKQSWRWFGPDDVVSLSDVRQAGATNVVHALHHIPNGEVWPVEEIKERQKLIDQAGLHWLVVESVPVHENIKLRKGNYKQLIKNYQETIRNLAAAGIHNITYNFMPVLDWTRTDLSYQLPHRGKALRFHLVAYHAFLLYELELPGTGLTEDQKTVALRFYEQLDEASKTELTNTILAGLPGSEERWDIDSFRKKLWEYENTGPDELRANLIAFLKEIVPVVEDCGSTLSLHPDDPPFALFNLPRVASTLEDYQKLIEAVPSPVNGMCFCSGSLGARKDNDLEAIIRLLGKHIHFVHLRSVQLEDDGSFYEANHLEGSNSMYHLVKLFVELMQKHQISIPMRPDHGHQLLDDLKKKTNPGYSGIGRLKGLAELRGLEYGLSH